MSYRITAHLPIGHVLTVTADAVSSGSAQRLPDPGDYTTQYAIQAVAVSSSLALGPFTKDQQYAIVSDTGRLTYASARLDASAPTIPLTLPTSDPHVANAPWLDSGVVTISNG